MRFFCLLAATMAWLTSCDNATNSLSQTIDLQPQPLASADLTWNSTSQILVVQLSGSGLAPGNTGRLVSTAGGCSNTQAPNVPFSSFTANVSGTVHQTLLSNSQIPSGLSQGTLQLLDGNSSVIACATLAGDAKVTFEPWPVYTSGSVTIVRGNTTSLQLLATGLKPHSSHAVGIYRGTCAAQGGEAYQLKDITADANGSAAGSELLNTGLNDKNFYLQIHADPRDHLYNGDGSPAPGFTPFFCANLA